MVGHAAQDLDTANMPIMIGISVSPPASWHCRR